MIVVGVDGSDGGKKALDFAGAEDALRETRLRILSAWELPDWRYTVADEALASVNELRPSLQVEAPAVQGHPADALLAQGADAELIVVGRRGPGGFKSLLLGSVSQQVVHHASCPVVVVG